MMRIGMASALLVCTLTPAAAQSWVPWHQPGMHDAPRAQRAAPASRPAPVTQAARPQTSQAYPAVLEGGGKPGVSPASPHQVSVRTGHGAGTVVVDTQARKLYLMQSEGKALAYPVSVGREGFQWRGTQKISRVADWPDWRPPAEMRQRQPGLPQVVTGGVRNPLGAKALYLGNSLYRIHGTNGETSIGQANSSGCIRMSNGHVVDLANRVGVGTTVVVR